MTAATAKPILFYGGGTGRLVHLGQTGDPVAHCGAQIAPASRAFLPGEKVVTCPVCATVRGKGTYMGPFGAWYDKTERDQHQYCPAEDDSCYFGREDECPAFAERGEK